MQRIKMQQSMEELLMLTDSEANKYRGIFEFKMNSLLNNVNVAKRQRRSIQVWIDKVNLSLQEINTTSLPLSDWKNFSDQLGVCFPLSFLDLDSIEGDFVFQSPSQMTTVGSFKCFPALTPSVNVDVVMTIPKICYNIPEDSLECANERSEINNNVFLIKRALYLCTVASHLMKSDLLKSKPEFSYAHGEPLKPSILLKPNIDSNVEVNVHMSPSPMAGVFAKSKLGPDECHLSLNNDKATPLYNSILAGDIHQLYNEEMRMDFYKKHGSFKEAMTLLKVWSTQRLADLTVGGFTPYILSMLVIYLYNNQKLHKYMTTYQILRAVWLELSKANWSKEGISLCEDLHSDRPTIKSFHSHFEVVFIDFSGFCNLTARMNHSTLAKVNREAAASLNLIDKKETDHFRELFLIKKEFILSYDHFVRYHSLSAILKGAGTLTADDAKFPMGKFVCRTTRSLERCLSDRCTELAYCHVIPNWPVTTNSPLISSMGGEAIMLGLKLCPINSLNLVTRGPSADSPEVSEFRTMWHNLTDTRRFNDGSICESIVWDESHASLAQRMLITKKIVDFVLFQDFHIESDEYTYIADQLDFALHIPVQPKITIEEVSHEIDVILGDLTQKLMGLTDIYLRITAVNPASPVVCQTEVFPPLNLIKYPARYSDSNDLPITGKFSEYLEPVQVVIQLETSNKWPNNLDGCERLLYTFFSNLAKSLRENHGISCKSYDENIILYKNGYYFNIVVGNQKSVLLKKEKIVGDILYYEETNATFELEKSLIHMPLIISALRALNGKFPGFHNTARMAKRWLTTQMVDVEILPSIVVDLLVAHIFLNPDPYSAPVQPLTGFLHFLRLLSTTDWVSTPIILNMNESLTRHDVEDITNQFEKFRKTLPALFIATPYDKYRSIWTKTHPTNSLLSKISKNASLMYKKLQFQLKCGYDGGLFDPPKFDSFHLALRVHENFVSRLPQSLSNKYRQLVSRRTEAPNPWPALSVDPIADLLSMLRLTFGGYAHFSYDTHGGLIIGVDFLPSTFVGTESTMATIKEDFIQKMVYRIKTWQTSEDKTYFFDFGKIVDDMHSLCKGFYRYYVISPKIGELIKAQP